MPTVLREGGFDFVVFFNDHGPPHVHAYLGDVAAVIRLAAQGPVLHAVFDMKGRDVRRALLIAARHQDALFAAWRRIHDQ